jgi:SH3-like domain-containing protein
MLAVILSVRSVRIAAALMAGCFLFMAEPARAGDRFPEPVCVMSPKAKLRAAPTTSSKITWTVARHMPLERLDVQNDWSKVRDLRGQVHWVISRNVAANQSCAVVRVRSAALVKGPGEKDGPADFRVADRYTPFKKVDREGLWVRVEDDYKGKYWTRDANVWIPVRRSRVSF